MKESRADLITKRIEREAVISVKEPKHLREVVLFHCLCAVISV